MPSEWKNINKEKPELKQQVLVFTQGYDVTGNCYWCHYELAVYDVNYTDRRRKTFYQPTEYYYRVEQDGSTLNRMWKITAVTHWQCLPEKPPKISKEKYAKLAGYDYA